MKHLNIPIKTLLASSLLVVTMSSCKLLGIGGGGDTQSGSTGAEYATEKDLLGYRPYNEQELPSPPGMVFVQGGRTVLGSFEQDLYGSRDNVERTVTVNSFFMDETERTNGDWKEYVHHQFNPMDLELPSNIEVVDPYSEEYVDQDGNPRVTLLYNVPSNGVNGQSNQDIIPKDNVWESQFAFNSVYAKNYYSNPGFNKYPVVGVTWRQVRDFCVWRTDFVNLNLIMEMEPEDLPEDFSKNFFAPTPEGDYKLAINGTALPSQEPETGASGNPDEEQYLSMNDFFRWQQAVVEYINIDENETKFIERGIYLPDFRLPNEAEWEYAAKATIGTVYLDENEEYGRIYPWDGRSTRNPYGKRRGEQLANFKRGRGDYAGIAGGVNNDGSVLPEEVGGREANDFNLYNMAGNVSEWVYDTYRPLAFSEFDDMNPVRKSLGEEDQSDPQTNYDWKGATLDKDKIKDKTLDPGQPLTYRSLVNDRARVYKGGSWKDVAYWMAPGTRRYLDMDQATSTIGFRCAMISIGTQQLDQSNGIFGGLFGGR